MDLYIFEIDKNPWMYTAKDVKFENNILECFLKQNDGSFKYNRIEIHPLLLNKYLINDNGGFQYQLTSEEDDTIMGELFHKYEGPVIDSLIIDECQMLSVDIPKYNDAREVTLNILKSYILPPINVHMGYTNDNYHMSKFSSLMANSSKRLELTVGMLEIFDKFVNKYKDINENAWLLYFEDDVRPVNIPIGTDLGKLYNVPTDAELIRPYIGRNTLCNIKNMSYNLTYSGGYAHAFYISVSGCKKVINYANKYSWRFAIDIDLFKLGKGCGGFPTGLDGWNLSTVYYNNNISNNILETEKIIMYSMSDIIFNQTSLPCAPFNTENNKWILSANPWILSAKDIKFKNNILECFLKRNNGTLNYNRIEIHPLLLNKHLINKNGGFRYQLTREEDDTIMKQLFPKYEGPIIDSLIIKECQILSVDIPKYNDAREVTLNILKSYTLPPINVHMGYTEHNYHMSKFSSLMANSTKRLELTVGMLEIFENFVNKYKTGWLLYFEDDVRPVNVPIGTDLGTLYNVPADAELIRPYIGENTLCDLKNMSYNLVYGGGLRHAFYISVKGCQKIINFAKKYRWYNHGDVTLFKLGKGCGEFPTGYDAWSYQNLNGINTISPRLLESEKIIMYSMSHVIFNQTSVPCAPFNTTNT